MISPFGMVEETFGQFPMVYVEDSTKVRGSQGNRARHKKATCPFGQIADNTVSIVWN